MRGKKIFVLQRRSRNLIFNYVTTLWGNQIAVWDRFYISKPIFCTYTCDNLKIVGLIFIKCRIGEIYEKLCSSFNVRLCQAVFLTTVYKHIHEILRAGVFPYRLHAHARFLLPWIVPLLLWQRKIKKRIQHKIWWRNTWQHLLCAYINWFTFTGIWVLHDVRSEFTDDVSGLPVSPIFTGHIKKHNPHHTYTEEFSIFLWLF